MPANKDPAPLIGSIDEGTSSTRFSVFSMRTSRMVAVHQIPIPKICPKEGWVEQDPILILEAVKDTMEEVSRHIKDRGFTISNVKAVGITNQRETTVAWDSKTGRPLHNAIVWLDMRTTSTLEMLLEKVPNKNKNVHQKVCGLPLSPYFSALKMKWLLDNVEDVRNALHEGRLMMGTMDTWLIWNLTGGPNGGLYMTDVTNASRTMLMNLDTLSWDNNLCKFFEIPIEILPEIRSSSEIYARISQGPIAGIPIAGCVGDQQSALLGQVCLKKGQAKSTYGTGCFLLYNTGNIKAISKAGLLTTVAFQLGKKAKPVYALEGSVAVAGAAMAWLKDNIGLVDEVKNIETMAMSVHHSGDVYFVPAFSGLYAPYWQSDARGVICGITEETQRSHILRAAMEAICFQTRDILEAMHKDTGLPLSELWVDGGMIKNNLLMQLQADLCGVPVVRPHMAETTSLGAAIAAGLAEGVGALDIEHLSPGPNDVFSPKITGKERNARYSKWKMAVERSFGWDITGNDITS
ncbi:glycerol kinase [Halyomorpha halys]|uniref:glycerol kinase n=1 Tax=Halyomorpha halys TaxID=286706 RepID=UPI0006D4F293